MKTLKIENDLRRLITSPYSVEMEEIIKYPQPRELETGTSVVAIGDLHGNAIKFLYFLIKYKLVECSGIGYLNLYIAYMDNNIKNFVTFLKKYVRVNSSSHKPLLVLIGDTLADRGMNDYMTLKVYELLKDSGFEYIIIFSNHDQEFIVNFHKKLLSRQAKPRTFILGQPKLFARSMINMHQSIMRGEISDREVESLVRTVYIPNLKLVYKHRMAYSHLKSEMVIFTHAPVDIPFLQKCRKFICRQHSTRDFDRDYMMVENFSSIEEMIDAINANFSVESFVKMHNNFDFQFNERIFEQAPLLKLVWNKTIMEPSFQMRHKITFIHGHIGQQVVNSKHIINLDSHFGKEHHEKYPFPVAMIKELVVCGSVIDSGYFARSQ
ncbi:metallophosphoesterase [Lentisphaerota bacterium ZTH]|nr:metallophosphoesterase [Lentisphaerota bacterium]WET07317.1 metallophosphoesterase [Lentisphaerota bacterium ZTH]